VEESEPDPDPKQSVPTVLWLILGVGLVVAFCAVMFLLRDHGAPRAFGPPAGSP